MKIWTAPSTRTCFKNSLPQAEDTASISLSAAKGEFVSFQILVRNDAQVPDKDKFEDFIIKICDAKITLLDGEEFDASNIRIQAQEYISFADEIAYPDALSNGFVTEICPGTTQGFWVTLPVTASQLPGEYKFRVDLKTEKDEEISSEVLLKVYDVLIPPSNEGEYFVAHFQTPEDQVMLDYGGYDCKAFEGKWWDFMKEYARSLRECRSNVYRVYPLCLLRAAGSRRISETEWKLDFTLFDKMVSFLREEKVAKLFSIDDIITPLHGRDIHMLDENGDIVLRDISDPIAEVWAKEYFSALYEHIDAENWVMHIQDEPMDASTWIWARELVKKYMPGIRCGNPIANDIAPMLGDDVDVYIPIFHAVERDVEFFEKLLQNPSKEVWAYCCCFPDGPEFLNRFIDRPAIQSRLIAWATYSRGFSGFLHYGYSYWQKTAQFHPYGIEKYSKFKGDCMMVYPSPEDNSYRISIRYINIRDGAQDFELFKIAEKTNKAKAVEIVKSIASGYNCFVSDEKKLLAAREELLQLAQK